ncbi:hypothetical protein [Virgibacillus salexigens]|uniref:Uncharacterized protein n=1 Tax=Virgibacillus kapii TaxID=1638645 RepID=A0ABQ2DNW7_9BACI|nr:hypothetical protein [Virgibacillus kapii]GGJ62072.1 hypothetical protein GCM10007111_25230 [Virgibacillus kapii]
MPKLSQEQLNNIDKSLEELAHEFALLTAKSKMESSDYNSIGDVFVSYVKALDLYKSFLLDEESLKDFLKS